MAEKIKLSKKDRMSVAWRHQFLQGSWNYERMQNGGWCYSIIPAIKKLYPNKEDKVAALKRQYGILQYSSICISTSNGCYISVRSRNVLMEQKSMILQSKV